MMSIKPLLALLCLLAICACSRPTVDAPAVSSVPVYSYRVIEDFPHDPRAFTQGLQYHDGHLYEGTGLQGFSSLRKVEPDTGRILRQVTLPEPYFGEGVAIWSNRVHQLTWRNNVGFIYDLETLRRIGDFAYEGEGWGLAYDGRRAIMSDGSHRLRFLDPATLDPVGELLVTLGGHPLRGLNELAIVRGEIWANVFPSDMLARIDPESGEVTGLVDLTGLLGPEHRRGHTVDVLNGIAHDPEDDRIFVTGKLWPRLFVIEVVDPD